MKPIGDHFSAGAQSYARFRPTYPTEIGVYLSSIAPGRSLAWDAGTGSGQAAVMLAQSFDRVVATDPSDAQLAHAEPHSRVQYQLGREAHVDLSDASCDLVTAAQAAHWFDMRAFAAEARRVLRPAGIVALWCYAHTLVDGRNGEALTDLVRWLQFERVGQHWPLGRDFIDDEYRSLEFPFERIDAPAFTMERSWTRPDLVGYVGTWSAVARCRAAEGIDPMEEFIGKLDALWSDDGERRRVWSPVHLLVGRV